MSKDVKWLLGGLGLGLVLGFTPASMFGAVLIVGTPFVWIMWRMNRGMNQLRDDIRNAGKK